jgi:hypothetical protein
VGPTGTLAKGQGSPGLNAGLWGNKGLSIRLGCIGITRAQTQCTSISQSNTVDTNMSSAVMFGMYGQILAAYLAMCLHLFGFKGLILQN